MTFKIKTDELKRALEYLSPYVYERVDDDPMDISFDDKVTFEVYDDSANISVFTNQLKISVHIWASSNEDDVSFCFQFDDIKELVDTVRYQVLVFDEDRFFGFDVSSDDNENWGDSIRAFSTSSQEQTNPDDSDTPYPQSIAFDKNTFIDILAKLSPVGNSDSEICFHIDKGRCTAWCSDLYSVKIIQTEFNPGYTCNFNIQNRFLIKGGINILKKHEDSVFNIGFNDNYLLLSSDNFAIECAQIDSLSRYNVLKVIISYKDFEESLVVAKDSIVSFLKRAKLLCEYNQFNVFHIMHGRMTMHCIDKIKKVGIHEYTSVLDGFKSVYTKVNNQSFLRILEDIPNEYIKILNSPYGLYISDIGQSDDDIRVLWQSKKEIDGLDAYKKESQALILRFSS